MQRWTKWVAPMAALVLMAGFQSTPTRADDAPEMTGKATVTVTVVDADGKPVAGADVSIMAAMPKRTKAAANPTTQPDDATATKKHPTPLETGTTSSDGTFALTKVPNGDFTVAVKMKKAGNGRAKVTIADDKDQTVSITLKPRKAKNQT